MSIHKFVASEAALRLDVWLAEQTPQLTRRRARLLCESGKVFINGHAARAGAALREGSVVEVHGSLEPVVAREIGSGKLAPAGLFLDIAFEDGSLLVVRKPRGISTVTLREDDPPTLADLLVSFSGEQRHVSPDPREAGLLQRLDYWTSGFALAARSRPVWEALRAGLFEGKIEKSYIALVEGELKAPGTVIEKPLRASKDGKGMELADADDPDALSARSDVSVIRNLPDERGGMSLVRVLASRARRHQVRVHLASIGHPLTGDRQYGARRQISYLGREVLKCVPPPHEGFLLHAERLAFCHPVTRREVEFSEGPSWLDPLMKEPE